MAPTTLAAWRRWGDAAPLSRGPHASPLEVSDGILKEWVKHERTLSVTEIAKAEEIGKSYVSRILRLSLLAPDIVDAILAGTTDLGVMLEKLAQPLPAGCAKQRHLIRLRV